MGMGNYLIPDYPEQDELADEDSDYWAYVNDMEAYAAEEEDRLEREIAKADAYLDAERDLELMRQVGAL